MSPARLLPFTLAISLMACSAPPPGRVGPAGGTVTSPDGVTLTVPAGALTQDVDITIGASAEPPPGALGTAFLIGPEGQTFLSPVQVELPFTRTDSLPNDVDEPVFVLHGPSAGPLARIGGTISPSGNSSGTSPGRIDVTTSDLGVFAPATATSTLLAGEQGAPQGLVLTSASLFWTNHGTASAQLAGTLGTVMRAPLGQNDRLGAAAVFASGQADPRRIVIDADFVYWSAAGTGMGDSGIVRAPLTGDGGPALLVRAMSAVDVAVDPFGVYLLDEGAGAVVRADRDGGNPTTLCPSGSRPASLVVGGGHLFWVSQGTIGESDGQVLQVPTQPGGAPIVLAGDQAEPAALVVDDTSVYWINKGDGSVRRVPIGGGDAATLHTLMRPTALALDQAGLYVADAISGELLIYPKSGGRGQARSDTAGHVTQLAIGAGGVFWVNEGGDPYTGEVRQITLP